MSDIKAVKDYQIVIFGVIIALGAIFSTAIFTKSVIKYQKLQNQTISTTGSASKPVKADFATISINYKLNAPTVKVGYNKMANNAQKIKNFLVEQGIDEKDITFGQISNYEVNKRVGNYTTNEVDFYKFNSYVKASSKDVDLITKISNKTGELVNMGIETGYNDVQYLVSNLDDIKIEMVGKATQNAKQRAESMVKSTGDKIGSLNSAKMGVFQIVPINSTEVTDYGINDTSSPEKNVIAVVNATFTVK